VLGQKKAASDKPQATSNKQQATSGLTIEAL